MYVCRFCTIMNTPMIVRMYKKFLISILGLKLEAGARWRKQK